MLEHEFSYGFPRSFGTPDWPELTHPDFSPIDQSEFDRFAKAGRLHEVFDSVALKHPDRLAVIGSESLTYRQLRQRAGQSAIGLNRLGVKPGDIVCIIAKNDWQNIAAMLGALHVGATCNLVAPDTITQLGKPPIASLNLSGKTRIFYLTESKQKADLVVLASLDTRAQILEIASLFHAHDVDMPALDKVSKQDFPAFIFFTSGSTGTPQAVAMSHQFILLDIARQINDLAICPVDRFDLLFSPNFSAFLAPTFGAILTGASLWIRSLDQSIPTDLIDWLAHSKITISTMSVSVMRALLRQLPNREHWPSLRILSVGAEPLRAQDVSLFHEKTCTQAVLQNAMATTETRTYAQFFFDRKITPIDPIPIGYPVLNRHVEILDDGLAPVSTGQVGHVRISSELLAAGYLAHAQSEGSPFEHTGEVSRFDSSDLGYFDENGLLYCVGRQDSMIKIRGQKVYLNQIETEILRVENISNAFVFTHVTQEDNPFIVACIESYETSAQDAVYDALLQRLPPIAHPCRIIKLEQFPRTTTGKIDRQALIKSVVPSINDRVSVFSHRRNLGNYADPRNEIEEQLVQIWQEILGIERIGIQNNFFALGGHSLLAVQLFHAINQRFQKSLPIALVFQRGSIAQIASCIEQATDDSPIARVVRLSKANAGPKLIVMPGLNGQLLYAIKLVERLENRFDICGLEPHLSHEYLETFSDFRRLANEYVKIILEHQPTGPFNFVGYSYGGFLGYEIARQLQRLGHRVDFVGVIDTGPDPRPSSKHIPGLAAYWMRVLGNLPSWVGANCGPEDIKETAKKANRRLRYIGRRILSGGKTEYRFEDEFGHNRSHDSRREILGRIFQGFNGYQPESYTGRVTLFRASVRPLLHSLSPDLGWSRVAREVIVHRILGDHNTILESAGMNRIGDLIAQSQNPL